MFQVKTMVEITKEQAQTLLTSSFETGFSDWIVLIGFHFPEGQKPVSEGWYEAPFIEGGYVEIGEDGTKNTYIINKASITRGLEIMAEKYPKHFADILNENDDAVTADLFLQCLCFGEERYA